VLDNLSNQSVDFRPVFYLPEECTVVIF